MGIVGVKLLLMPVIGIAMVWTASRWGLLPDDPLFLLCLVIQASSPSATALVCFPPAKLATRAHDTTRALRVDYTACTPLTANDGASGGYHGTTRHRLRHDGKPAVLAVPRRHVLRHRVHRPQPLPLRVNVPGPKYRILFIFLLFSFFIFLLHLSLSEYLSGHGGR